VPVTNYVPYGHGGDINIAAIEISDEIMNSRKMNIILLIYLFYCISFSTHKFIIFKVHNIYSISLNLNHSLMKDVTKWLCLFKQSKIVAWRMMYEFYCRFAIRLFYYFTKISYCHDNSYIFLLVNTYFGTQKKLHVHWNCGSITTLPYPRM